MRTPKNRLQELAQNLHRRQAQKQSSGQGQQDNGKPNVEAKSFDHNQPINLHSSGQGENRPRSQRGSVEAVAFDHNEPIELRYDQETRYSPNTPTYAAAHSVAPDADFGSEAFEVEAFDAEPVATAYSMSLIPEVVPERSQPLPTKSTTPPVQSSGTDTNPAPAFSAPKEVATADDFLEDLQAILKREKTYDGSSKQVVDVSSQATQLSTPAPIPPEPSTPTSALSTPPAPQELTKQASPHDVFDRLAQGIPPEPSPTDPPASVPTYSSAHSVFDLMGKNMAFANSFDLGTISLQQRFDEFDRMLDAEETKSSPRNQQTTQAMQLTKSVAHEPTNTLGSDTTLSKKSSSIYSAMPVSYSSQLGGTKQMRVFCTARLEQSDLHNLMMASEDLTLATGDQSLGEAISSFKKFYYECEQHKQFLMDDICRLDEGLSKLKNLSILDDGKKTLERVLSDERLSIVDDLTDYHKILKASNTFLVGEEKHFKELLLNACYPPFIPKDSLIFVTCKDAGGQGDIINAVNTKNLLEKRYRWNNVHLAMARTAHDKAKELGYSDVWLIDDERRDEAKNIRNWKPDDKSSNVMVVHVAARLNGAFEKIIKESCTKGSWKNAKTIFLSEYGYSNGSTGFERGKSFEYTMGFGVGELGIHINQAFIAASQLGKTERLHKLRNIKAKWLSRELLGEESVEAYSENHRLYVGYSHHSCILFLKLVACMESFIPTDKGMTVDIVLVGNENKKKGSDISQHYEPLIKNLDDDKYILNNLGLSSIEIAFWNLEKEELKSQKYCPKNSNRKPEDEEIKIEDNSISLRYFFAKMNSNLDFSKTLEDHAKDDNQFLLLKLGKWLSMPETQTRFKQIEHTILKYRNFENLFGSYISRESRNGNQADDNYREQEEKNKGKDIYDLEWDLNNAESLDDVIKKAKELYDEAHKKFARSE